MGTRYSINFLLPAPAPFPIGGYKVVYEYANRLAASGYIVSICHALHGRPAPTRIRRLESWLKAKWWQGLRLRKRISWFEFGSRVDVRCISSALPDQLPNADFSVATAWSTAPLVAEKIQRNTGIGIYLIQGLEMWDGKNDEVKETWALPLNKIAVSRWLQETICGGSGDICSCIPNGIDFSVFSELCQVTQRNQLSIGMLWHKQEGKGCRIGLDAINSLREKFPELSVIFFGVGNRSPEIPDWIEYIKRPALFELQRLYNRCAIFLAPSFSEGWGLTPCEAMACGCCVVATDIGGHREFCVPDETALLVPPRDAQALADAVAKVLKDQELRVRLAKNGHAHIQQFTWDRSVNMFESLLGEMMIKTGNSA